MLAVEFTGLGWLGVRTERFEETVRFFRDVMGLQQIRRERVRLPRRHRGGGVEPPEDEFHSFFGTGPVVGFRVEDVDQARSRMEAEGVEFLGPVQRSEKAAWVHFRGPDENVYEIVGPR